MCDHCNLPVVNSGGEDKGPMYHISSDDYKSYFLSCLEQAMQLLSDYGHVTHYKDLPDEINDKSIILSQKMSEIEDKVIGLSIADSENISISHDGGYVWI